MAAILQNSEEAGPFLLHDFSMCLWLIPSQLLGNFLPTVFWHTQNHPLIPIPTFHLQLTKGHFHLTEFSLGNLSNLPVLRLPQPITPVKLSNCNSRAVLQHFTPILEMFSSSFWPRLVKLICCAFGLQALIPLILQNMIPLTFSQIPEHVPFTQPLTFTHFTFLPKMYLSLLSTETCLQESTQVTLLRKISLSSTYIPEDLEHSS